MPLLLSIALHCIALHCIALHCVALNSPLSFLSYPVVCFHACRWFLGIQSKKDPGHVMTEVYKALHAIGCTWYAVNNYRIICQWRSAPAPPSPGPMAFPNGRAAMPDMSLGARPPAAPAHVNSHKRHFESVSGDPSSMDISEPLSPSTRGLTLGMGNIRLRGGSGTGAGVGAGGGGSAAGSVSGEDDGGAGVSMRSVDSVSGDPMSMSKMMRLENAAACPAGAGADTEPDQCEEVSVVKVALSLYNVQQHIYLLDFQKSEGDAFSFMKICAMIITELKNLAQASRGAITITQQPGSAGSAGSSSSPGAAGAGAGTGAGAVAGMPGGALPMPPRGVAQQQQAALSPPAAPPGR
jgi:hypothetical protein